ncbi:RNA polymerase recycling motor ATPase HelR [Tsukamurella soli]|uniref:RNA polymerase recycling motor ATPase HelR n=1 Tax=Tsukamurella soli TaxID=644556 RepID=A0ABP8JQF8_9ACTN
MNPVNTSAFNLPERLAAKARPELIAADERHLTAIADDLGRQLADLSARLEAERRKPSGLGQETIQRDAEVRRLAARLRAMRRFGVDLCLGRMVFADGRDPVYIGRLGVAGADGRDLLIDWRSPAAEPFFGATYADPMGLTARRRYRWTHGRITDYWDEVFDTSGFGADGAGAGESLATLDDQSAFIASLGASRSPRMRDVLGTIAADQDAIIRAGSHGALVVDGGPGTGKTVVALHRAAYLVYSDPHLGHHRGGVLFVGPHEPYLAYVADVLPSLGEEGVQTCTLRDLVTEGAAAVAETDPEVARLKSSGELVDAIDAAVRFYEQPPRKSMTVETDWADIRSSPADWADAFAAPDPGTPHNEAREQIWEALIELLADRADGDAPRGEIQKSLRRNRELRSTLDNAWTLIEAADLVGDLWSVPAYLKLCAPFLTADQVRTLQRADAQAWTASDLPLLDAARRRLGDPQAAQLHRRRGAALAAEREQRAKVIDELLANDMVDFDFEGEGLVSMLRNQDLKDALIDEEALPRSEPDELAGPFAHIVVDEAQELTDAQWRMLLSRCPSGSLTIVGDRAQARSGFAESWRERLERIGLHRVDVSSLSINYRTPEEVMAEAAPVIRAALPDANVPTSVRSNGIPVTHAATSERDAVLAAWLGEHPDGIACVIGDPGFAARPRVRSLTPESAKGLEFDLVVLVDPQAWGDGIQGAVDRYVAMTRATQRLVILTSAA